MFVNAKGKRLLHFIALLIGFFWVTTVGAVSLNGSFNANTNGLNGLVFAVAKQDDGKMILAGSFAGVRGMSLEKVARVMSDGSIDSTFSSQALFNSGASVYDVAIQNDGKILLVGNFSSPRNNILRLLPNGGIDTSFDPSTSANSFIRSVRIQNDGKILIGGGFNAVSDSSGITSINRIARLNADGSIDSSFNPGVGANQEVKGLDISKDGRIAVTGIFTRFNGQSCKAVAVLNKDGDLDNRFCGFETSGVPSVFKNTIAFQDDGKLIFAVSAPGPQYNGVQVHRIVRLKKDGRRDSTFRSGIFSGINSRITNVSILNNGKLLVSGGFTVFDSQSRRNVALLNEDGSLNDASTDLTFTVNPTFFDQLEQDDGSVLLVGQFNTSVINGENNTNVVRVDKNLNRDTLRTVGFDDRVRAMVQQSDGKVIVSGFFNNLTAPTATSTPNRIIRLNQNGTVDTSFQEPNFTFAGVNPVGGIYALASLENNGVLVGGKFAVSVNGTDYRGLVRLDKFGSLDQTFSPTVTGGAVQAILVQPDGKILIAGDFLSVNGQGKSRIVRLNEDGSTDASFNGFLPDITAYALGLHADGKILVGGDFLGNASIGNGIRRLNPDGSVDQGFQGYAAGVVRAISPIKDGKVLISGSFTNTSGTVNTRYLQKLNADGTLDSSFDASGFNGPIYGLASNARGDIYVGGSFSSIKGVQNGNIARLKDSGVLDTEFSNGQSLSGVVSTVMLKQDGTLSIGGDFTSFNNGSNTSSSDRFATFRNANDLVIAKVVPEFSQKKIMYRMDGAAPLLNWLTLEVIESNGDSLGATLSKSIGVRNGSDWEFSDIDFATENTSYYLRFRGTYGAGRGSGSFIDRIYKINGQRELEECSFYSIKASNGKVIAICI